MIAQLRRLPMSLRLLIIFGISAALIFAPFILHSTFVGGPDVGTHIFSSQQFSNAMRQGIAYPRWLRDWYGGYGAPIGIAYPPFLYYCVGLLSLIGIQTIPALKIILWLSLTISGIFTYKLVRLNNLPAAAFLAAFFYQAAPYRLIDLYERTALPEFMAFLWLPLITFAAVNWVRERKLIHLLYFSLSFAALICTHSMIAYISGFFGVGLLIYIFTVPKESRSKWTGVFGGVIALILGGATAAIYIIPALIESQLMFPEWLSVGGANVWGNYHNNFIFGAQVYKNTSFTNLYPENVYISIATLLTLLIAVIASVLTSIAWKQRQPTARNITLLMIITVLVSAFMSSSLSVPLWSILPKAENIAFPWRWQTLSTFACSYLVGDIIHILMGHEILKKRPLWMQRMATGVVSVCLIANFIYAAKFVWSGNHAFMTQEVIDQLIGTAPLQTSIYEWVFDEPYRPQWSKNFDYSQRPATLDHIETDATTKVEIDKWYSQQRVFSVSTSHLSELNVRLFWFPGWVAFINNKPTAIDISPLDGTMNIQVPEGKSEVNLMFEDTQIREISKLISIICVGIELLVVTYIVYRRIFHMVPHSFEQRF